MGAQRPCGRSTKNRLKTVINPSNRHKHRNKIAAARLDPGRCTNGHVNHLVQETATTAEPLQFSALSRPGRCRHNKRHVNNLVLELDTTRKHNRDIDHLVNVLELRELHSCLHCRGKQEAAIFSTSGDCEISTVSSTTPPEEPARPAQQGHRSPYRRKTRESLWFLNSPDHEDRLSVTTRMSTTTRDIDTSNW